MASVNSHPDITESEHAWTGVVVALPQEAQCLGFAKAKPGSMLDGPGIRACVSGMGEVRAERAARQLIDDGARALISFGTAGALDPALHPGALLLPRSVIFRNTEYPTHEAWHARVVNHLNGPEGLVLDAMLHAEEPLTSVRQKHAARRLTQTAAVDMESGAVARVAESAGVPFLVLRVVADPAWRALPGAALVAMTPDGHLRPFSLMMAVARKPSELIALRRLALDFERARSALRSLAQDLEEIATPLRGSR